MLRYEKPAADWMTEALPIGNGRFGGMVFGGVDREHIQFNEDSLWTGDENDTGHYQNFGDLFIDFDGAGVRAGSDHPAHFAHEGIEASVDVSSATKWCVEHKGREVVWVKAFPGDGQALNEYALTSANDVPARDPRTWLVEGSRDGKAWEVLDRHENEPPFPERGLRRVFQFKNASRFASYRIRFLPSPDVDHFQVAEIELGSASGQGSTDYRRELDISQAIHRARYARDGVHYQREAFCSHPDQVLVIRFTADQPGRHSGFVRLVDAHDGEIRVEGNRLTLRGALSNGLKYEAQLLVIHDGGQVEPGAEGTVRFRDVDALTLLLVAGTNYLNRADKGWRGDDPRERLTRQIDTAASKPFDAIRAAHIADYQQLFNRVTLDLGARGPSLANRPTRDRLEAYSKGGQDPALEAMFFQYGRYLLASSSRPGSLPANLQGLWNNSNAPPWRSDYHTDVNVQMNYWPADLTNLSECFGPLFEWVDSTRSVHGRQTREQFHARGWTSRAENGIFGGSTWEWIPAGSAWLCQNLHDHAAFTGDRGDRERLYPILKEVCEFWEDRLKPLPDGTLVAPDDFSPEHGPREDGVSFAQQLVWALFTNYLETAQVLDRDPAYQEKIAAMRSRLLGPRIGHWGQLQEWMVDRDDPKDNHRHVSHMIALYPGRQISPLTTPELAQAARVSLTARGDESTGWSIAWKLNLWARLLDGDHAYRLLRLQLRLVGEKGTNMSSGGGTYPNLLDAHPPFQIDGNFGATAGIAELLLQSHLGAIHLLPALPAAWPDGQVAGLRARGGFTVDETWKQGKLTSVTIHGRPHAPCKVRLGPRAIDVTLPADGTMSLNGSLEPR